MKIAETYIHLRIDASEEFCEAARGYLYYRGNLFAKDCLGKEIEIFVRIEDGSFKAWLTVVGALIFMGISNYGSFRSGIDHIINDARAFSEYVISDFLKEGNTPGEKVVRLERRLGVPGKIQRIFKRIDHMQQGEGLDTNEEVKAELEAIKKQIIRVLEQIEEEKDRDLFLQSLPNLLREELPPPPPYPDKKTKEVYIEKTEEWLTPPKEVKRLPPSE